MPRVAPIVVLLALLAPACGGASGSGQIEAWNAQPPYLPPPDPSLFARDRAATPHAGAGPKGATAAEVKAPAAKAQPGLGVSAADSKPASGAPSDAEIAAELRQAYGGKAGTDVNRAAIDAGGLAITPPTAPPKLLALIRGANEVARKPYVYGGGHGRNPGEIWEDSAYDCSGSVSYALAAAGYIDGPMDSSSLARWGRPGPGRWVTIYANGGHAFMVVAGLRFDTSGRQHTGTRWQSADGRSYAGFTVRHPPGL
jgi:cell wall-associated NlpC family hydrolase